MPPARQLPTTPSGRFTKTADTIQGGLRDRQGRLDDAGVKRPTRLAANFIDREGEGHCRLIGPLCGHGVKRVRDGKNPGADGYLLTFQSLRISAAIVTLVVREHQLGCKLQCGAHP